METIDISWQNLILAYSLLAIPVVALWYYHTGLVKDTLLAALRMTVQLFLMGLYLVVLFELNNAWVNILWLLIMVGVSTGTTIRRSGLPWKKFVIPIAAGTLISIVIVDAFFLGLTIQPDNMFEARYFITITGMVLGNTMKQNIIALQAFYKTLTRQKADYRYCLANGATRNEALKPFMKEALKMAFNPQIATMAVMGLIAMPGAMTGQILGGSAPDIAIKYQILLMLSIFIACMINVVLSINLANRLVFDDADDFGKLYK